MQPVADLNHPNIVRTEAIEQIGDRAVAIIMEYVQGGTVRDRLHEYGPFSAEHAEAVLRTSRARCGMPISAGSCTATSNPKTSIDEFLEHLTYDPPPVLSQEYPAGLTPSDADPTLRFRPPVSSVSADSGARPASASVAAPNAGEAGDGRAISAARDMPNTGATPRARERPAARRDSAGTWPRALTRRRVLLGLALFAPLLIAAGSWCVLLGGPSGLSRLDRSGDLTASAGTIALDTTRRSDRDTGTRAMPSPPVRATHPDAKAVTPPVESQPRPSLGKAAASAAKQPKTAPVPRAVARRNSAAPGRPSPRCGIASMADQRACLLAYIALNDT